MEDDAEQIQLFRHVMEDCGGTFTFELKRDGEQAMAYLRSHSSNEERSDLVLLDLDMPRLNGLEVLHDIKADPNLKRIPVILFISSAQRRDIGVGYEFGANCYVTKPDDLDGLYRFVRLLQELWGDMAQSPPRD